MTTTRAATRRKTALPQALAACCSPLDVALDTEIVAIGAARFKALADTTRLTMLALLAGCEDSICVCDLNEFFDLEQPTISHHLKILRDAGLVTSERRGTWAHYQLHPNAAAWVRATLAALPH